MSEQDRAIEITQDMLKGYDFGLYRKTGLAKAVQMNKPFQVMTIQGNLAGGVAGDYLMVNPDNPEDVYPCKEAIFDATYEKVDDTPKAKRSR